MTRTTAAVLYVAVLAASAVAWLLSGIVKGWAP